MAWFIGITIIILTLPIAFLVLMQGSNWETGEGGNPIGGFATLGFGWIIAAFIIITHYYPIYLSW